MAYFKTNNIINFMIFTFNLDVDRVVMCLCWMCVCMCEKYIKLSLIIITLIKLCTYK